MAYNNNNQEQVYEADGEVQSIEKANKATGELYYKVKINDTNFSVWEPEIMKGITLNDEVRILYTEKQSTYKGNKVTYRNIKTIKRAGDVQEEYIGDVPAPIKKAINNIVNGEQNDRREIGFSFGMAVNSAAASLSSLALKAVTMEEATEILNDKEQFEELVKNRFESIEKLRKELVK